MSNWSNCTNVYNANATRCDAYKGITPKRYHGNPGTGGKMHAEIPFTYWKCTSFANEYAASPAEVNFLSSWPNYCEYYQTGKQEQMTVLASYENDDHHSIGFRNKDDSRNWLSNEILSNIVDENNLVDSNHMISCKWMNDLQYALLMELCARLSNYLYAEMTTIPVIFVQTSANIISNDIIDRFRDAINSLSAGIASVQLSNAEVKTQCLSGIAIDFGANQQSLSSLIPNANGDQTAIVTTKMKSYVTDILDAYRDCICYSDCGAYSICFCYGNCNYY